MWTYLNILIQGVALIMAFYHLGLFVNRPDDKASLLFSLFMLNVFLYNFVRNDIWSFLDPSKFLFALVIKTEYICLTLMPVFVNGFLRYLFQNSRFFHIVFKCLLVPSVIFFFIITFLPTQTFTKGIFLIPIQICVLISVILIIVGNFLLFYKEKVAKYLLGITLILVFSVVLDLLKNHNIISFEYQISPVSLILWIFVQGYILSKKFSYTFQQNKYLNDNLKKEVAKKTHELEIEKMSLEIIMEQV